MNVVKAVKARMQQRTMVKTAMALGIALVTQMASAATGGESFKAMADMLKNWSEGYLGMTLALAAFVIGLAVGLVKQTVMPAIVGVGVAMAAVLGPGIITGMFTAVI